MKLLLLAFLGLAGASQIYNPLWLKKEHVFEYVSAVITGIPELGAQYAGLRIHADMRVQMFGDHARVKLENARFKTFNKEFVGGVWDTLVHHMELEADPVPAAFKLHLEAPFQFMHRDGVIVKILVEATEPEFITNIKKAAISQAWSALFTNKVVNDLHEFVPTLKTMETTVVGECETHYNFNKLPAHMAREFEEKEKLPHRELCEGQEYFEMIKTKDLRACKQRPIFLHMHGVHGVSDGGLGSKAPFAIEDSVTRAIICGKPGKIWLRKVENRHNYITSPTGKFESKEKMQVAGHTLLRIKAVMAVTVELPLVQNAKAHTTLMFEFPAEDTLNAAISHKTRVDQTLVAADSWFKPQVPMPNMINAPHTFTTNHRALEEEKENVIRIFLRIVTKAHKAPESSFEHEDAAGSTLIIVRTLARLGLVDIKDLWTKIEARVPAEIRAHHHHAFLDLVSMTATNPCMAFIIEHVKAGRITNQAGAWIVANAIRNIKTPTVELMTELIAVFKLIHVQGHHLTATVALTLTQRIHEACIHETTAVTDFPVKIYGRFCDKKSPFIVRELIPFLAEKLFAAAEHDIHHIITYVNALGNLGHDAAALHLLKVIEGQLTRHAHVRSVAVYQLMRAAAAKPTVYRPILLDIIENVAESAEVRMAAITVLPYTRPTAEIWNKLAIRTWFDPSEQVVSYVWTTLKTIAELPNHSHPYTFIGEKAREALRLARPAMTGIQTSHGMMIFKFLDTLKAAVNVKLQYINTPESIVPKNLFFKQTIKTETHRMEAFESSVYTQGAEYFINKMYEAYNSMMTGTEKAQYVANKNFMKNILRVENRVALPPAAHITVKMLGLQRLFSIDATMIEEIIETVTRDTMEALNKDHSLTKDFVKIIDLMGHKAIMPTETGLPLHLHHATPLVISGKAALNIDLRDMTKGRVGLTMKPVVNYKQTVMAHLFCPFTGKFLGAGVDTALHVTLPLTAEIAMHDGHYIVTLKTPEDRESQRVRPLLALRVRPYTTVYDMGSAIPIANAATTKVIRMAAPLKRKEFNLGRHFGLSLMLDVETQQPFADFAEFFHNLRHHNFMTLFALPLPFKTVREHTIRIVYNPKESVTKAASFAIGYGFGEKAVNGAAPRVWASTSVVVPAAVKAKCTKVADEWLLRQRTTHFMAERETRCLKKQMLLCEERMATLQPLTAITAAIKEQCRLEATTKCKTIVEKQLLADKVERMEACEMREVAEIEKVECRRVQLRQSRPSHEVESFCSMTAVRMEQRHRAGAASMRSATWMFEILKDASRALTINVQAALHGANFVVDQKIETQFTIGQKFPVTSTEEGIVKMNIAFKLPNHPKPFAFDVESNYFVRRPAFAWDLNAMMTEDLTSKVGAKVEFGWMEGQKEVIALHMIAQRTDELKQFVRLTKEFKLCEQMLIKGEKLNVMCKRARRFAAILDLVEFNLALPKTLVNNFYFITFFDVIKAGFLPYLMVEPTTFNLRTDTHEHFKIHMKTDPRGKLVTLAFAANERKTIVKNLRHFWLLPMLPMQVMDTTLVHAIKRATKFGRPSWCAIENNKVRTFDRMVYDYALNNCEHVAFRDCTANPKVMVTVKKTAALHIVKAIIDHNKYELELVKGVRGRTTGTVKINGQVRQPMAKVAGRTTLFEDIHNRVVLYEDGVFEIFSLKYGMAVLADHAGVEVKTFQWALRNLACGLCGDMNDEKTADLKSAGNCIMTQPKLAAFSYMVQDGQCAGIPAEFKPIFQKEAAQCTKMEVMPAKVLDLFQHMQHLNKMNVMVKHVVIEMGQRICFGKEQIKVCGIEGTPKGIMQRKEIEFFCVPKDREGLIMRRMAERGEKIERVHRFPTEFPGIVYEPEMC